MPTITSVVPQNKSGRSNIFLDGEFAFGVDEDTLIKYRLVQGKSIDQETLRKVALEAEAGKLITKIYNLLSFRPRSEKEVRDYLKRKNLQAKKDDKNEISEILINIVIEALQEKGLINDLEFAKAWIESRLRSGKKSLKIIKLELIQKGIDKEIINRVFEYVESEYDPEEIATNLLEKKLKNWQMYNAAKIKAKAIEFLLRKGFDLEDVKRVVAKSLNKS